MLFASDNQVSPDSPSSSSHPIDTIEMDVITPNSKTTGKLPNAEPRPLDKKDYALGIVLLLAVVCLWTLSNFVTQDLFEGGYEKPFLVTYLNTSAFSLYLIPFLIRKYYWRSESETSDRLSAGRRNALRNAAATEEVQPLVSEESLERGAEYDQDVHALNVVHDDEVPLTERETAALASVFCVLWFVANWSVNASLDYTSVASATVLTSMSGFFTLGIGRIFRVERLTLIKIIAVVVSFFGVILVSLSDSHTTPPTSESPSVSHLPPRSLPISKSGNEHPPRPMLGDALALLSALFYAIYVTLLKVRIRNESRIDMQLFFGFVGLANMIVYWPMGLILHYTGAERLELPTSSRMWAALAINMIITLLSDFLYVLAMLKTTPLVVTVGLSLTIPFAVFGDFLLHRPADLQVVAGAALVLVSFVAIGMGNADIQENNDTNGNGQTRDEERYLLDGTREEGDGVILHNT